MKRQNTGVRRQETEWGKLEGIFFSVAPLAAWGTILKVAVSFFCHRDRRD
jgi:hypothetical protein